MNQAVHTGSMTRISQLQGEWGRKLMMAGLIALSGCGGATHDADTGAGAAGSGSVNSGGTTTNAGGTPSTPSTPSAPSVPSAPSTPTPPPKPPMSAAPAEPPSETQAARFLARSTYGVTTEDIAHLRAIGYSAWIDEQFAKPITSHRVQVEAIVTARPYSGDFYPTFWNQAVNGEDQLRQRVKFALSEIFVISLQDPNVAGFRRGAAAYYDVLGANAFGNFRDLFEGVTLNPMMGLYLNSLHNTKEGPNKTPDENFARECMQLFSIGLFQLNSDGSVKSDAHGPIPTYTLDDITNIARVFTGFSWSGPDTTDARFDGTGAKDPDRDIKPMQPYSQWHSVSEKKFLGVTIPAGSADARADLKVAIDTLFNHPNVGPFIGRQLIQRLVTSNPSPAYIGRVAAAFANNGMGVRGDMKAVVKAVLLDPEALSNAGLTDLTYGKVREPVVRLAQFLRTFKASSVAGTFSLGATDDPGSSLGQSALAAPSVFNFFRPNYSPPGADFVNFKLVAPELQGVDQTSVVGYGNFFQRPVPNGFGYGDSTVRAHYDELVPLADNPGQLVDRIDLLLSARQLSPEDRSAIVKAISTVSLSTTDAQALLNAKTLRAELAVYLALTSPAYLVQK